MTKAIAYIRWSSDDQAEGSSIERQTEIITAHAGGHQIHIVETFIDNGFSASTGRHISHGKLGEILCDIDSGKLRGYALLVEKMDRFSRLDIDETTQLMRRLIQGGVELHLAGSDRIVRSLNDLNTVLLNAIEAHVARAFITNLKVNVQRGMDKLKDKAAEGIVITRNLPWWLTVAGRENIGAKVKNPGKIEVILDRVAVVQEVFRLAALGLGCQRIAQELGDRLQGRSLSWVTRSLRDRSVLGEFTPVGREPIPNYFPVVIAQTEFDAVQALLDAKRQGGKLKGGNTHSHEAQNLFSGLIFDHSVRPSRPMTYQQVAQWQYLSTSFSSTNRTQHRLSYDKFEPAFLGFLSDLNWREVVGQTKSAELDAAEAVLNKVLAETDRVQRRIAAIDTAMEADGIDAATLTVLATRRSKDESLLTTLTAKKDVAQAAVEAARAKCTALDSPELLLELVRSKTPQANAVRLRLRMEIRKRVSRIEIKWNKNGSIFCRIMFVNGAKLDKGILFTREGATLCQQTSWERPVVPGRHGPKVIATI
jgi:DNA invertase Pin-like site-specific DNA recombinase